MRRARLALADIEHLTDADRHEIMCVWSRRDVAQIDSRAMDKLRGQTRPNIDGLKPAAPYLKAGFVDGKKKPPMYRINAAKPAANDAAWPHPVQLSLIA